MASKVDISKIYSDELKDTVFILAYMQDLTPLQISEKLDMPLANVTAVLRTDVKRLKKYTSDVLKFDRQKHKLNFAKNHTLSLYLSCLHVMEERIKNHNNGTDPMFGKELLSYVSVLSRSLGLIENAMPKEAPQEEESTAYSRMKSAQVIEVEEMSDLPDSFDSPDTLDSHPSDDFDFDFNLSSPENEIGANLLLPPT